MNYNPNPDYYRHASSMAGVINKRVSVVSVWVVWATLATGICETILSYARIIIKYPGHPEHLG